MLAVEAHMADVDQLLLQGVAHKAAKRIVADAPDKPADAAKTGDTLPPRWPARRRGSATDGLRSPAAGQLPHLPEPKLLQSC